MNSPLRVVHLNSMLSGGGTDDQCVKLASELHRIGQDAVIAGPAGRAFAPVIAGLGAPFIDTGASSGKFKFISRIANLIRREGIQIVHGHHGRDLWPAVLAAKLSGRRPKIVLTRHMAKSPSSWASRHFLLNQCDAMIAVSEFTARVLREGVDEPNSPEAERRHRPPLRGDPGKIHVIHGGIDTLRFRPADAQEKRREWGLQPGDYAFAVVGGYDLPRGKGQREFLAAAARLHRGIPHARFLIIGRGAMAAVLQSDIERLGLTGKAWLTGHASDMPEVMNAIDCLVHPQIGTEALGLVVCEAHACGKPVIASALDGIPEAFHAGAYGALVPPEDIDGLARAMSEQCAAPKLTLPETAALHDRVAQSFSLPRMAAGVLRLYHALLTPG
ncbi:MAG TPA: glycosyltransferase [Candidatus Saccharimonadales bacterium]|nr:glycosyltransferase [Candidatus Saccharimonadales bacterium]